MLHPGSAKTGAVEPAIERAGKVIAEALAETESCPLHLENTAGAGGTLGRSFEELAALLEAAGGDERLGVCLDSCHLLASGYDDPHGRGARGGARRLRRARRPGPARLAAPQRLARRRWAPTATATPTSARASSARDGCAAFLSEPRFDGLPCVLETPGPDKRGPTPEQVQLAKDLRRRGLAKRRRLSARRRAAV